MKSRNSNAGGQESLIQCIEVLISRNSIAKNLQWILSVYSLENNPVSRQPAIHNCDVYHFMNFDWKRTVKQLLEDHQVPYSIIQYFTPPSIHAGIGSKLPFDENTILSASDQMGETYGATAHSPSVSFHAFIRHEDFDLIPDGKKSSARTPAAM